MKINLSSSEILNDAYKFFFLYNGIVASLWLLEIIVVFIFKNTSYTCTSLLVLIDALFMAYLLSSLIINIYHLLKKEIPSVQQVSIIGFLTIITALGWYLSSLYINELYHCSYSFITRDQLINIFASKF